MFFHELETERMFLKNITAEDREFCFQQFSDPDITEYLYDAEPYTDISEADEIIDFYTCPEPRGQHRWIMVLKDGAEKIGTCGFHCWNRAENSIEIGYDLRKEYWGKGFMSEAVRAILAFAADEMKLKRIDAHIYPENLRSVKLAEKLGFVWNNETTIYTYRGEDYIHNIYTLILA